MLGSQQGKQLYEYVDNYVVFDLETTGLNPNWDTIIEVSAVKVRMGERTETFSMLVNPERPIPSSASMVNHITNEMVKQEPTISEVFPQFLDFIGDDILVGHNIHTFDMKFIHKTAEALYGNVVSNNYIDTLSLARQCLPQLSRYRLVDIAAYFQMNTAEAHRALQDCIMTQACYEQMRKIWDKQTPHTCPVCGGRLLQRQGRYGAFLGCSNFPQCRYTENCR